MSKSYRDLMMPRRAERFRYFDRIAAEREIELGLDRGSLHFSRAELERNNDDQMLDLLTSRAESRKHVLAMADE